MEEIDGGKLSGSVQGVPVGDVKLVPGKRGLVLYVNGIDQRVNLGNQRHNCMGDLTKSHNGFLMAMWIQVHSDDDTEFYISNRGQTRRSIGVALWLQDTKIEIWFRTSTRLWKVDFYRAVSLDIWYHVVLAWNIADGGKMYINGILVSHDQHGYSLLGDANRYPGVYPGQLANIISNTMAYFTIHTTVDIVWLFTDKCGV